MMPCICPTNWLKASTRLASFVCTDITKGDFQRRLSSRLKIISGGIYNALKSLLKHKDKWARGSSFKVYINTYSHVHNMDLSNLLNNLTLIVMKSKLSLKRVPYNIFKIQIVNLNSRGKTPYAAPELICLQVKQFN